MNMRFPQLLGNLSAGVFGRGGLRPPVHSSSVRIFCTPCTCLTATCTISMMVAWKQRNLIKLTTNMAAILLSINYWWVCCKSTIFHVNIPAVPSRASIFLQLLTLNDNSDCFVVHAILRCVWQWQQRNFLDWFALSQFLWRKFCIGKLLFSKKIFEVTTSVINIKRFLQIVQNLNLILLQNSCLITCSVNCKAGYRNMHAAVCVNIYSAKTSVQFC